MFVGEWDNRYDTAMQRWMEAPDASHPRLCTVRVYSLGHWYAPSSLNSNAASVIMRLQVHWNAMPELANRKQSGDGSTQADDACVVLIVPHHVHQTRIGATPSLSSRVFRSTGRKSGLVYL